MLKNICNEFIKLGFKKDVNPRTLNERFSISKKADGKWFKNSKHDLHSPLINEELDLSLMPSLKILTDLLDEEHSEFKKSGGRIFITENLVYQIKRGTEYALYKEQDPVEQNSKYGKIITELVAHGLERDRFRTEETYLVTKSPRGEWSASTNHINHSGKKILLDLTEMTNFKILAIKINKADPSFESNGGRIFISPNRVYRIKNQLEMDFRF
jgi:hypothetical protein